MKTVILAVAAMLAMVAGVANAQTANAGSASQSAAGANSGSNSGATAVINFPVNPEQQSVTSHATVSTNSSGTTTIRTAPNVVVSGPASGPCNGLGLGAGGSWLGGSAAFNFSKVDEGCEERETARVYAMVGDVATAKLILDNSEVMVRTRERQKVRDEMAKPKVSHHGGTMTVAATAPSDADLCSQARAKDDKALALRVCR